MFHSQRPHGTSLQLVNPKYEKSVEKADKGFPGARRGSASGVSFQVIENVRELEVLLVA